MEQIRVEKLIKQEPLFMGDISRMFIDWTSLLSTPNPSLFFGVGLCTSKEPATAIPFDILALFLVAEKLRRNLQLDHVFILIGDAHAATNIFMTPTIIQPLRNTMHHTFVKIIHNLHLSTHFQIVFGSQLEKDISFQSILSDLPEMDNGYVRQEIADLLWFTSFRNVRIKLGWSINNDLMPSGHDERFFDNHIRKTVSLPLTFLHVAAGRTFDEHRPKTSPYISIAGENRILLSEHENVQEKISILKQKTDTVRAALSHLNQIVRLFESLFIKIPKDSIEEKVQFITDLSTHG
jgi:hypothetical protein